jgi:YidC/Oxa1 family membrane protein insertase
MLGFLDAGVSVAYHAVSDLTQFLSPLGGGLAAVAAIVAFTIAVRLLLAPLSYYALRGQAGQARLQPELAELRRRYAHQPERLQREISALYQREGGSLLIGCLPLLLQLPFFSVMYRLFLSPVIAGQPNQLLAHPVAGVPLGAHVFGLSWLDHGSAGHILGVTGLLSVPGLVFAGLIALLAVVGWASARLAQRMSRAAQATAGQQRSGPAGAADPQARAVAGLTKVLPYFTVVIALFVPLAAGIYLLTTTAWTLAERAALRRRAQEAADRSAAARARTAIS